MAIQIVYKKTKDLIPYINNPRKNDDAVKYVAESIKEFGFLVPIVIDGNGEIIAGHTRLKAAKKLRISDVPCVVATDLTDEQVRAFRLADNKVSEMAEWDPMLLQSELDMIPTIDMSLFSFDDIDMFKEESEKEDPGNEEDEEEEGEDPQERTLGIYNLRDYDSDNTDGWYQMPILEPCDIIPDSMIGFHYILQKKDYDSCVHFFKDDYKFERVWQKPQMYIDIMRPFKCVLTPDFSLYLDMPRAMKVWNVYRSRLIGQMCQREGLNVIPTVQWAEPATYDFCFDGLPKNSTVCVSTIGVKQDEESTAVWLDGMEAMIDIVQPKTILVYGGKMDFDYKGLDVRYYDSDVAERAQNWNG